MTDPINNPFTVDWVNSNKQIEHQRIGLNDDKDKYMAKLKTKGKVLMEDDLIVLVEKLKPILGLGSAVNGSPFVGLDANLVEDDGY